MCGRSGRSHSSQALVSGKGPHLPFLLDARNRGLTEQLQFQLLGERIPQAASLDGPEEKHLRAPDLVE